MLLPIQNIWNCWDCYKEVWIQFINGKIKNWKGDSLDGEYDFVLQNNELKLGKGHSILSSWGNVDFAWTLFINKKWKITYFSNASGHYKPSALDKRLVIDFLNSNNIELRQIFLKIIVKCFNY